MPAAYFNFLSIPVLKLSSFFLFLGYLSSRRIRAILAPVLCLVLLCVSLSLSFYLSSLVLSDIL